MQPQEGRATPEMLDQIGRALNVICRPALRRAFLANPWATLEEHGAGDLPEGLVDVLANMTYEELGVVARLCDCEHGYVIGMTLQGGKVCFL